MIWYRSATWWIGVAMILLTIIIIVDSASWSLGGKLFPWMIGTGVLITAGLHTILGVVKGVKLADDDGEDAPPQKLNMGRVLSTLMWVLAVLIAVPFLGLQVAIPGFVLLFMKFNGESLTLAVLSALVIFGFIVFILEGTLHIVFPQPYIIQWIGF
jgi:hypothetical protein